MEKILVSACLCGINSRYDGGHGNFPLLEKLKTRYEIVAFCPEVEGGLSTPRPRAEIVKNQVLTEDGKDVTKNYIAGAEKALQVCKLFAIRVAILNDKSPSCGSRYIHDGSFKNNIIKGLGYTARLLIANGIKVYSDKDALDFLLPKEDEERKPRTRKSPSKARPERTFKKKEPFKKEETEEKKPFEKNKPFEKKKRSFEKKDSFKKEKKPFRKDAKKPFRKDEKKPFDKNKKKSFGEKKTFSKGKFDKKPARKTSFKKSSERRPYNKKKA